MTIIDDIGQLGSDALGYTYDLMHGTHYMNPDIPHPGPAPEPLGTVQSPGLSVDRTPTFGEMHNAPAHVVPDLAVPRGYINNIPDAPEQPLSIADESAAHAAKSFSFSQLEHPADPVTPPAPAATPAPAAGLGHPVVNGVVDESTWVDASGRVVHPDGAATSASVMHDPAVGLGHPVIHGVVDESTWVDASGRVVHPDGAATSASVMHDPTAPAGPATPAGHGIEVDFDFGSGTHAPLSGLDQQPAEDLLDHLSHPTEPAPDATAAGDGPLGWDGNPVGAEHADWQTLRPADADDDMTHAHDAAGAGDEAAVHHMAGF